MTEKITSWPLSWPQSYPRTAVRLKSRFVGATFFGAVKEILVEIKRLKGTDVIVSTNVPIRADGMPYGDWERRKMTDPGVAVYFKLRGSQKVVACDKWVKLEDNAHAITKSIEAMRGLDRWGVSQILERAFTGFTALPAPPQWWDTLGVNEGTPLAICEAAYRAKMKDAHPDAGGSETLAANLNWAIARAREEARAA